MPIYGDGLFQYGGMPVTGGVPPFVSRYSKTFFVDPVNGSDGNDGHAPSRAFASLYRAHFMMTSGNNDVCYLIGNGATSGTARLSLANALAAQGSSETPATTGTLTWSKSACHLIGITAPTSISQRCRIAPPTTGTRSSVFNSGNFIVVSGQGCYFSNFEAYCGFATGDVNQIAWTDSGGRNCYSNIHFAGMGDSQSAADAGSSSLLISGTNGENTFMGCTIGINTQPRGAASAELIFAGGSPRNRFESCIFDTNSSAGTNFWVSMLGGTVGDYAFFRNCFFANPVINGATVLAEGFATSASGSPDGYALLQNCGWYGATSLDSVHSHVLANSATGTTFGKFAAVSG
jgi:hypothetical protein